jgi:hypothetical protein
MECWNTIQAENKEWIWWALYRYFPSIVDKIGPDSITKPENAMTMRLAISCGFSSYLFALEPLDPVRSIPSKADFHWWILTCLALRNITSTAAISSCQT